MAARFQHPSQTFDDLLTLNMFLAAAQTMSILAPSVPSRPHWFQHGRSYDSQRRHYAAAALIIILAFSVAIAILLGAAPVWAASCSGGWMARSNAMAEV